MEKKVKKTKEEVVVKKEKYLQAIGRRKTAIARVRIYPGHEREFIVNGKPLNKYFTTKELQSMAESALEKMGHLDKFKVEVLTRGGGITAQAEAVRHGIARALVLFDPELRKLLRKVGHLTRDPRARERKKFGLKRARRAPQWQKR